MRERRQEYEAASLADEYIAFGPLEEVVHREGVTDVAVTGDGRVWADAGVGMREEFPRIPFISPQRVKEYAIQLCAQLGSRLDDAHPIADASMPSGLRVHAVLEPLVPCGASLSIRIPPQGFWSLVDLEHHGFLPPQWVGVLAQLVRQKASIVISGGTGTGKTTLLRALLAQCDADERIVTVEEIREIGAARGGNTVSLVARESNVEGAGGVGLSQLVAATVRMRPDRIVLGECRGAEVADLLRAFNTGHRGGMVTVHCNGVEQVPQRLVGLGQLSGLSPQSLIFLAQGAFDVVVHLVRAGGRRRLACIGVLAGSAAAGLGDGWGTSLQGVPVARWEGVGAPSLEEGWNSFAHQWGLRDGVAAQRGERW